MALCVLPEAANIAVIGGGPAGLMAAETLAGLGHRVTVFDAMASVGRKFLLAGRGGLNLTHSEHLAEFMPRYGPREAWVAPYIHAFTPDDLRAWALGLGQETFVGSSGRVFPKAMKASPLLRAWLARLADLGVKIETRTRWTGWDDDGQLALIGADGKEKTSHADASILALGGASWAKMGSDGAWQSILANKGVEIAPLTPANCAIKVDWSAVMRSRFAGKPIKSVAVRCGQASVRGDMILTEHGLEGGPIYALIPAIRAALASGAPILNVDLRPDEDIETIAHRLVKSKAGQSLSSALKGQGHLSPIAISLMREACANQLPTSAMGLARLMKAVPVTVKGLAPIDRAISSAGGIAPSALTQNLMLEALPGVFAAGEMLDWEAPTGGYLLQACFASGKQAAYGVHAWLTPTS